MEVEVVSPIASRSIPRILTGKLQAQLQIGDTTKAKKSQYLSITKTEIIKQQIQPPYNNRPKWLLLQASSNLRIGYTSCKGRESNTIQYFKQKSFNMKIAKKKARMQSPLVNPIIDLERPLEKVLKK